VDATFLAKLTRTISHAHVSPPPSAHKSAFVPIPLKTITDAFIGMPKKSAPHRDGWTWELFRDAANRPSTAALLRKIVELFVNGRLPKAIWKFLSSAIVIPFHKLSQPGRDLQSDPRLRPITIGSLLTRYSCKTLLRVNMKGLAERMLRSNQFSFGIPDCVQHVILGCTVALQCDPDWVLGEFDLKNAQTNCSLGLIWQELIIDTYFHFLCMYGDTCTPQTHYGNGPDQAPTSIHWSGDGPRQGETVANVFFNILAARLYRAFMKVLNGRGIILAIADDVKICAPPSVLADIVDRLPALAMSEAGLTTQASKILVHVQPSARAGWIAYLDANPRSEDRNILSIHDIPVGRLPSAKEFDEAFYDPCQGPSWPENDGIDIFGIPLGSPSFVEKYLHGNLIKH
jgi:hypothetical protein